MRKKGSKFLLLLTDKYEHVLQNFLTNFIGQFLENIFLYVGNDFVSELQGVQTKNNLNII